jgi:hypothetical protein
VNTLIQIDPSTFLDGLPDWERERFCLDSAYCRDYRRWRRKHCKGISIGGGSIGVKPAAFDLHAKNTACTHVADDDIFATYEKAFAID